MVSERRKTPRLGLAIPVRVQGFLADDTVWEEITSTIDVSAGGACFPLSHEAELGQVLLLSLALPKRLRQHDLNDVAYRVYSLVRGVRRRVDQPRVGVMFFGRYPPRGFHEKPAARYLLPTDSSGRLPMPRGLRSGDVTPAGGVSPESPERLDPTSLLPPVEVEEPNEPPPAATTPEPAVPLPPLPGTSVPAFLPSREVPKDRRNDPRVELFVNFTIQQVDEWGAVLQEELTVADNMSRGGARVMTSLGFHVGDVILLQEAGGGFATRAEVRGVTRVRSAVDRLHLRFLDRQSPDRLLRQ